MRIALTDTNGNVHPIEVEEMTDLSTLQVLIEFELKIPKAQQVVTHDVLGEIKGSTLRFFRDRFTIIQQFKNLISYI